MNTWNAEQPYNHLPPLPPKHDIESKAVLKQCINARAALAELKQAAELIPNQSMLINTLPTMEARASSEIENIITTTDKLFQYKQQTLQPRKPCDTEAHCFQAFSHSTLSRYVRKPPNWYAAKSKAVIWKSAKQSAQLCAPMAAATPFTPRLQASS